MLQSPFEAVRADCVRLVGLLLRFNTKNANAFTKTGGYDVLLAILGAQEVSP